MAKVKNRNVYRGLIVWMVVFLALAALACAGYLYTQNYLTQREKSNLEEVKRINSERVDEYNAALAEAKREQEVLRQNEGQWPAAAAQGWDVIDLTSFSVKSGMEVLVTRAQMLEGGLLLVNRWHPMPADLTDDMMVSINRHSRADEDADGKKIKANDIPTRDASSTLQPIAVEALMKMFADARATGLDMDNIVIDEGYRTMETQSGYWNSAIEKYSASYSGAALDERVRRNTSYPGTSDYQAGLSVSMYNYKSGDKEFSNTPLHETAQGKWIYENAWKYGYVFRFPVAGFPYANSVDKSYKTGINLEMKVYRYVGTANAAVMKALDLCLEEYIEYMMLHPHVAVYEDGALKYEIYRLEGGYSDTMVTIPNGAATYSVSSDNMGGLIVSISY